MPSKFVVNIHHTKRYDVYVGRKSKKDPGEWGNKYVVGVDGNREECVRKHRQDTLNNPNLIRKIKRELKGKIIGCFCAPKSCHADIYAEIANSDDDIDPNWLG